MLIRDVDSMIEKKLSEWFVKSGYECFENYPLGGKFPDVIAIKNDSLTAFEVKSHASELTQAIGQCLFYLRKANKVYIAMPPEEVKLLSSFSFDTLKESGIGLVSIDNEIKIIIEAREFHKNTLAVIEKIRNEKIVVPKNKEDKSLLIRNKIIKILRDHPEGLSLSEISKYSILNRQTATKYVYGLIGEGLVYQKNSGPSKLCYLKEENNERK